MCHAPEWVSTTKVAQPIDGNVRKSYALVMESVIHMIDRLGGVRKTASTLGLAPTTVQHWKKHDRVPAWREADLRAAYERQAAA